MPKTKTKRMPKRTQRTQTMSDTVSCDRFIFFEDDGAGAMPPLAEPEVIATLPSQKSTSLSAEMWRGFLREYAKPLASAPGWFEADGFRIELTDGRELPLTASEVNPSADTLLVLRTREPVQGQNDREAIATSAVPWSQVARISILT